MNRLTLWIPEHSTRPGAWMRAMNLLQDHGIISDLCVSTSSVARQDVPRAIEFLQSKLQSTKQQKEK